MNNKYLYYIVFFIVTLFLLFLGCSQIGVDTTAPSIENKTFSISDNSLVGEFVGKIKARDNNGVIEFNIIDGNMGNAFAINIDGELTIANTSSNFATNSEYILTLAVSDAAGNRAMANIIINLTNAPPVIEDQDFLISDTSLSNHPVGLVEAYDVRNMTIYSIKDGNMANAFAIDDEGNLIVNDPSSFDIFDTSIATEKEYTLTIEVFDERTNTSEASITITVKDLPPFIPSGQEFQIREHSKSNTVVDKLETANDKLVANDDRDVIGYRIIDGDDRNAFKIDNNGIITLTGDVDIDFETTDPAEYVLTIEVLDTAEQATSTEIIITIINFFLLNIDNVMDSSSLALDGASSLTTATVGGTTYLFVAGFDDDRVSVFSVGTDGVLTSVHNVPDNDNLNLDGASSLTTATVGGTTYLFVAGFDDDGVSVFSVETDGVLTSVHNVPDNDNLNLDGASSLTTATVGGTTYLFVAGFDDDGVSVFSVETDGVLTSVHNVPDNDNLNLDGARSLTTETVGGTTYLFVAGFDDDGVSVFSVRANGILTSVHNVPDNDNLNLDGARSLTTETVGGTTYLFVAGFDDDGVSVFSVRANGILTSEDNVTDAGNLEILGSSSLTTTTVGNTIYLFVAGFDDDGVSVFSMGADGDLISLYNQPDNNNLHLDGAVSVTTAIVGRVTYLFVHGQDDSGLSVFRVDK